LLNEQQLQQELISFIRAFGLHQPETTPCGQPVAVSEAHALLELLRAEPLSQVELANWLQLEKSSVSRLVQQLERKEWLIREPATDDRRVIKLRLSDAGRQVALQLSQARAAKFKTMLSLIPEPEQEVVTRALKVLTQAAVESQKASGTLS
jgi:DNA-binding MarR family transcriptional regulator